MADRFGKQDISNKAVVAMLIAVVIVSVVSLGWYMNALQKAEPLVENSGVARVSVSVQPAKDLEANALPKDTRATGKVTARVA